MEGERTADALDERLVFTGADGQSAILHSSVGAGSRAMSAAAVPVSRRSAITVLRQAVVSALETERDFGSGFVAVPVLLAAGAVTYFCLPKEPHAMLVAAAVLIMACATALVRRVLWMRAAGLAVLSLFVGVLAGSVETWRHSTQMMGSSISTHLTGRLVAIELRANGRTRLTIDVIATERPQLRYAPARIRATAGEVPGDLAPGDGVRGVVRLLSPSGPARPHGYDFAFENYFDGIGANGFFLSGPFPAQLRGGAPARVAVLAWVERQRLILAGRIRERISGPEGEVAAALVAGVRGGIPDYVTEALRKTGLAHILAISGLHMALVAGTVVGAMRLVFALFPGFSSRHPVKKYAAAGGLLALSLYLVISGAAVAAQRAYVMFAVMLVAVMFDRAALTMRNLAIAGVIILAVAPHEVMGPSFQMSFAATAALVGAYGWYSERQRRRQPGDWARRTAFANALRLTGLFFAGLAATSIIAGLATGLFAAWHFQRVAPLGLFANLAAMPIVTIVVMPCAVAGVLAMPLGLDGVFFAGMGHGLALVIAIAEWLAERSPVDAVGAIPPLAVVLLAVALVQAVVSTTWLRSMALPIAAVGLPLILMRDPPDVLISENSRLVAMPLSDGRVAVNTRRPSTFTLDIWMAALNAGEVAKPEGAGEVLPAPTEAGFRCAGDRCVATHKSGAVVAYAKSATEASLLCDTATLMIIGDATADGVCANAVTIVLTKRDLAMRGSAEVRFRDGGVIVRHAIGQQLRPWHAHRKYSREARGLPPYRRRQTAAGQ